MQIQKKQPEVGLTRNIANLLYNSTFSNDDQTYMNQDENDDHVNNEIDEINGDKLE